jgi:outer membrane biosynthesis protein TonB
VENAYLYWIGDKESAEPKTEPKEPKEPTESEKAGRQTPSEDATEAQQPKEPPQEKSPPREEKPTPAQDQRKTAPTKTAPTKEPVSKSDQPSATPPTPGRRDERRVSRPSRLFLKRANIQGENEPDASPNCGTVEGIAKYSSIPHDLQ